MKKITVGSRAFFQGLEGFESKDLDIVVFEENPTLYNFYMERKENGEDTFRWKTSNVFNYDYSKNPMALGKFLVPEVLEELGKVFADVEILIESEINNLKKRHQYQKVIFEFYKENGSATLTEEQRLIAFESYKENK